MTIPAKFIPAKGSNFIQGPVRPLFQERPVTTAATTLFSNPYFGQFLVPLITVCNMSATQEVTVTLYHDEGGTSFTDDTAITAPILLAVGDTIDIERAQLGGYAAGSSIGAKVSPPGAATITGYGTISDEEVTP